MAAEEEQGGSTKRCPYCAEEILAAAKKCKHCGSMLHGDDLELTEEYPAVMRAQVRTGQTLNERYIISSRIARGGMAEIFLARDLELDMNVALKVVPPSLADDPRLIKHLRGEAKIAIQLTHQNIVRVYSFDASGEIKFIVMEFVPGKNLYQLLNEVPEGKFPARQVLEWLDPVCDALSYAHSLGVVHRDVKPSNIMVTEEGVVKVADFGIARRLEESMESVSQQTVRGTPSYMSPEQLKGTKLTVLSDIYSLSATVYMLLAGEPPFASAVIAASPDRPAPNAIVGIPPRLFRVITRCLEVDPHNRLQGASEFYDAAKDALARPPSTKLDAVKPPAIVDLSDDSSAGRSAEEIPIRVDAEELPEGLDAVSVALREKAAKAAEKGNLGKAINLYLELAAIVPDNPGVWCSIGDCRMKTGDQRDAITAYQKAIKAEYDNIYARFQIGLAYEQLDQPENAIRAYQQAMKTIEDNPSLGLEISLKKLKGQIQNVNWKIQQAQEERRKQVREMRERQEHKRLRAEERRRRMIRIAAIIVLILVLLTLVLGAAEYFFHIFQHFPF
jgi:serine/threonine protein kinase